MPERVILTIGTKKGLFVAEAPKSRRSFALRGPFGPGVAVYASLIDRRGSPRLYASSCNPFFGMKVLVSTDVGKKFKLYVYATPADADVPVFDEKNPVKSAGEMRDKLQPALFGQDVRALSEEFVVTRK